MKRFLIPLLAVLALPIAVYSNENNDKLLEYKKLIEQGYEILDDLILRDEKNPTYEEFMEEFSSALKKCNQAIEIIPENKEGYLCRGLMFGFHKKGSAIPRYHKKGLKDFTKSIKLDPKYLEAYYLSGILSFSMSRLSGLSIDNRAYKDIKNANNNYFPDAIEYVNRNKTYLKKTNVIGFAIK